MPYVPGFTNDIFISFSHIDDSDGWVESFEDHLRNRLLQLDAPVTIWRDRKLSGTDIFSDEIFTQLQQFFFDGCQHYTPRIFVCHYI